MKYRIIKILITGGIITLSFALQSSFSLLNYRSVATPNLLLITTCIFGFTRGCNYGSVTGLFCGLLVDIFFGDVIGLYALIYMYVGFFGGLFKKMFYSDHGIHAFIAVCFPVILHTIWAVIHLDCC